jgi:nicotinamidase-related amidase
VVVDMQNDYAQDEFPPGGGEDVTLVPGHHSLPLKALAQTIQTYIDAMDAQELLPDLVVFTRDWLDNVWQNERGHFVLTKCSWGCEVTEPARAAAGRKCKNTFDFLKSRDDWMTEDEVCIAAVFVHSE